MSEQLDWRRVGRTFRAAFGGRCPRCGKYWDPGDHIALLRIPKRRTIAPDGEIGHSMRGYTKLELYAHARCTLPPAKQPGECTHSSGTMMVRRRGRNVNICIDCGQQIGR